MDQYYWYQQYSSSALLWQQQLMFLFTFRPVSSSQCTGAYKPNLKLAKWKETITFNAMCFISDQVFINNTYRVRHHLLVFQSDNKPLITSELLDSSSCKSWNIFVYNSKHGMMTRPSAHTTQPCQQLHKVLVTISQAKYHPLLKNVTLFLKYF